MKARDYGRSGKFPIVDQGQGLVAGWTDSEAGLISEQLPVIVFGDHTRAFKYVDFPFVRGADGTQILKPKPGIDPLFFYFACWRLDLPSRGYNRHFKALKRQIITVPEIGTQRAIAGILRRVEQAANLQQEHEEATRAVKRAAMRILFTRGLRGEAQRESEIGSLPQTWDVVRLGSLGRIGNGSTPKKANLEYWQSGDFPWLTSAKVYDRNISAADEFVTDVALERCHLPRLQPGAVLIAITGQGKTLGHCAVLETPATISQHLAYVATDTSRVVPGFLRGYLETRYDYLRQVASAGGSTKAALTCAFLREVPVPLPPTLDEQQDIVDILDAIDRKINLHRLKRAVLDELFKVLLHKLMAGEIRVGELDLSALEKLKPAGAAA